MRCGHSGAALMLAGLVVSLVGAAIVLVRTLEVPGYWIPLGVGLALLIAGVVRRGRSGDS